MNRDLHSVVIDPEFQALIPPLSADERSILEASIAKEGVRDALRVWNRRDESILLDGHNRHAIASALGIVPVVEAVHGIETRDDAIVWIIRNQLGRRNLTDFVKVELAMRMATVVAARAKANQKAAGGDRKSAGSVKINRSEPIATILTREEIAKAAGVSMGTVERARVIKKSGVPELQEAVRAGDIATSAGARIATLPAEEQRAVVSKGPDAARAKSSELRREMKRDSEPPAPEPVRSPSERPVTEATKARDAKVKDMLDQGMSAREIAKEIGCERGAVYQAKSRIVGAAAPSHLNHVRDQADGFATALSVAIEVGERKWSGATREQRMAAVDALKRLNKTTRKLIAAIESAEEGGSQC